MVEVIYLVTYYDYAYTRVVGYYEDRELAYAVKEQLKTKNGIDADIETIDISHYPPRLVPIYTTRITIAKAGAVTEETTTSYKLDFETFPEYLSSSGLHYTVEVAEATISACDLLQLRAALNQATKEAREHYPPKELLQCK